MTLKTWMYLNAVLLIAAGIAFGLYAPLTINLYARFSPQDNSLLYWLAVTFVRMYGAALFGFGFLIWAVSRVIEAIPPDAPTRRTILLAMILANGMSVAVAGTQQITLWGSPAGWITIGIYAMLLIGYLVALTRYR